jgi:hypothetical protein
LKKGWYWTGYEKSYCSNVRANFSKLPYRYKICIKFDTFEKFAFHIAVISNFSLIDIVYPNCVLG